MAAARWAGYGRRVPTSSSPSAPAATTSSARIESNGRWLVRDGSPWFPVTGEIHYARLPRDRWPEVLGHARAGGLTSVACYVFWQAHEPQPGQFRWDGNRDLRAFVELAGQHGLDVIVRLGPWAHGEARYGGFPDWVATSGQPTRRNDPAYLDLVRRLYEQIAAQLAGLTHADGGPVVGAQVENELYDQPEHLATLRTLAEQAGLQLPIWTATGWGGAQVPATLLPVYSAYADGFWADDEDWPDFAAAHFDYQEVRDDLTVGADVREVFGTGQGTAAPAPATPAAPQPTPFVTCELGGGMHVAYHRRPLVTAQDVAALALAKIGSGSVWQGYYMYAGGTQRVGPHGTEQESQATGYPNDVPTRSYDFHAPLGEHGQVREHHHLLRRQHLWLATDGAALATMPSRPAPPSDDPGALRWAVRSDGQRGYLFLTTYQPARRPLPAQPQVQLTVELDGGPVTVPHTPVDVPAGVSVAWPLRYPLSDQLVLRHATAGLLTRVTLDGGRDLVVLVATPGVPVQIVVEHPDSDPVPVSGPVVATMVDGGTHLALAGAPGPAAVVGLPGVDVLVLDEENANRLYRLPLAGRDHLVLSEAPVYTTPEGHLVAHPVQERSRLSILPAPAALAARPGTAALAEAEPTAESRWRSWTLHDPDAAPLPASVRTLQEHAPLADLPAPARGGPADRLSMPQDFSGATRLQVDLPGEVSAAVDRVLLRITWTGDVGRALVDGEVVSDHFWHGRDWDVDLTPHLEQVRSHGLVLELLPWRPEAGVWVDPSVRDVPAGVQVDSVQLVQVPRVVLAAQAAGR